MALADTSEPQTVTQLIDFQRDCLLVIGGKGPIKGVAIKAELEPEYEEEINHGRLYPNLNALVDKGLVDKGEFDQRTNAYELTERGVQAIQERQQWEQQYLEGME